MQVWCIHYSLRLAVLTCRIYSLVMHSDPHNTVRHRAGTVSIILQTAQAAGVEHVRRSIMISFQGETDKPSLLTICREYWVKVGSRRLGYIQRVPMK